MPKEEGKSLDEALAESASTYRDATHANDEMLMMEMFGAQSETNCEFTECIYRGPSCEEPVPPKFRIEASETRRTQKQRVRKTGTGTR